MKKIIFLFCLLCACTTRITLNYDRINKDDLMGEYGNMAHIFFYNTLSGFLIKVDISDTIKRVIIRSGSNPKYHEQEKTWYVNIEDTLFEGEKCFENFSKFESYTYVGQHCFLYQKNNKLYLRFRTWLSPQEITTRVYKYFWKNNENREKWINWEERNIKTSSESLRKRCNF